MLYVGSKEWLEALLTLRRRSGPADWVERGLSTSVVDSSCSGCRLPNFVLLIRVISMKTNLKSGGWTALIAGVIAVGSVSVRAEDGGGGAGAAAQIAQLHELHAAFHRAVSVHDPVNGDSPAERAQRLRDVLSLWAEDAQFTVIGSSAIAGNYFGRGDPDDPSTCPPPSGDTSAGGKQGTICTLFNFVNGGLKPANKWVSLSPAYNTKFVVSEDDGHYTASVYFECHYFDVSPNPTTGAPQWTAKSHVNLSGEARKIGGKWFFSRATTAAVGVPIP